VYYALEDINAKKKTKSLRFVQQEHMQVLAQLNELSVHLICTVLKVLIHLNNVQRIDQTELQKA